MALEVESWNIQSGWSLSSLPPLLVPLVAIPHVIVAQFAVGGGFLLADGVTWAYRHRRADVLAYLRDLARFFVLLTIVLGAITGVGIWWTIGLTAPESTSALIHVFVFGWATEWVVFVVEIVSAFAFYYLWDRLRPREHMAMGWIYAASAWLSLVLITGITSFMLTTGRWTPERDFFAAFFNPSFLPQVLIRTGGSLAIAALWIGVHLSLRAPEPLREEMIPRFSRWAMAGMALILIGGLGYFAVMPDHAWLNMIRAPLLLIMTTLNFGATLIALIAFGLGHLRGGRWINPPEAVLMLLIGVVAITSGEFLREGARKPYRIEGYIFSPGVHVAEVATLQRDGLIAHSPWLQRYLRETLGLPEEALRDPARLPASQKVQVGEAIYNHHCAACHALDGYNGMRPLIQPWTPEIIADAVRHLHRTNPAMPPWLGNEAEREALIAYLVALQKGGP
ncbi:MAG: cytochrome ubiquinol oxidase subunit I [Thermoflexus sp.]|nr:cytochrome ubiquinol oxidase subunit I [Thermoflexus sp.]